MRNNLDQLLNDSNQNAYYEPYQEGLRKLEDVLAPPVDFVFFLNYSIPMVQVRWLHARLLIYVYVHTPIIRDPIQEIVD